MFLATLELQSFTDVNIPSEDLLKSEIVPCCNPDTKAPGPRNNPCSGKFTASRIPALMLVTKAVGFPKNSKDPRFVSFFSS